MSKKATLRGAGSVYVENIVFLGGGYLYWFIMAKITPADIVGTSSALISIAVILSVISSMAIPSGLQRFIGKTYLHGKILDAKMYVIASLVLMIAGTISSAVVIFIAHEWILGVTVKLDLVFITIILISTTSLTSLFRSVVISSLSKSHWLPIVATVAAAAKLALGITLVLLGLDALGLMIGFTIAPVLISLILGIISLRLFIGTNMEIFRRNYFTDVFLASVPFWIPLIVNTIGSHLGTIVVYGAHGAEQAAVYYISLSIALALVTVMSALYTVSMPVLSAMKDGRKRLAWRSIKMTLLLSSPLSLGLLLYSKDILSLFGSVYESGEIALEILILSLFPTLIAMGISALVYSYGRNRDVLYIGLALNVPRPLLYLLLVPFLDSTGAAISYTIGSIVGLLVSLSIARNIGMKIIWKEVLLIILIPASIGIMFKIINLNFILGIIVIILLSLVIFLRLKIITETDIEDSLMTLPNRISNPLLQLVHTILSKRR